MWQGGRRNVKWRRDAAAVWEGEERTGGKKAQCTSWNGDKNSKFLGLDKEFHTDMLTKGSLYKIRLHFPFMVKWLLFKW